MVKYLFKYINKQDNYYLFMIIKLFVIYFSNMYPNLKKKMEKKLYLFTCLLA